MTKYRFAYEETIYEVGCAAELVAKMHAASFAEAVDDKAYMLDTAERIQRQNGVIVRSDSHASFVEDLVKCGMVKVMP